MSIFEMMRNEPIINRSYLRDTRKQLRNNLTPAEAALWNLLKNKQLDGYRFRRQVSIENYVVDFYCPEIKLVIELDGAVHHHPQIAENDKHRDERLTDLGLLYSALKIKMCLSQQIGRWRRSGSFLNRSCASIRLPPIAFLLPHKKMGGKKATHRS